jgi:long-chain fatty acid transport protein
MLRKLLKFFIPLLIVSFCFYSEITAGGLALSGVGARAISMGGAFRGVADDWSACYWNPAGIATLDKSEINGTISIISPRPEYTPDIKLSGHDNLGYKNDTKWYTDDQSHIFPGFSGFFAIPGSEGWSAGVGLYVPYGTGARWDLFDLPIGYNDQPPSATPVIYPTIDHKSEFAVIDIHPTVACEVKEDELYVGAGASIQRGDVTLQQMIWQYINPADPGILPDNANKLYMDYELEGDGWGFGANAGLLYKPNEKLSIGLSYRSPVTIKLEGTARMDLYTPYNPYLIELFNSYGTHADSLTAYLFEGSVYSSKPKAEADLKLPADYGVGVSYRVSENMRLSADVDYTDWSRLDYIPIALTGYAAYPVGSAASDDTIYTKWDSTLRISIGMEYYLHERLALRAGYFNDPSPIPDETYTPTIPDIGTKNSFNIGIGWDTGPLKIDYNLEYIKFSERDIPSTEYTDDNGDGRYDNYPGLYKMDLFASFISVTHSF